MRRLLQAVEAFLDGRQVDAERLVFIFVPACAEADDQPPAGDVVYGRRLLGQDGRVTVSVAGDEDAEAHPRSRLSERGERGPALHARAFGAERLPEASHEVVHLPERVER